MFEVEIHTNKDLAARVIMLPSNKKITIPPSGKRERTIVTASLDKKDYEFLKKKFENDQFSSLKTINNDAAGN